MELIEIESESESESESDINIESKSDLYIKSDIEIDKYSKTTFKNVVSHTFIEYEIENFVQKLGTYTFGLDKIIPWITKSDESDELDELDKSGFIFSGGLLFDIIKNKFTDELRDIDLFFYGSYESKVKVLNKIFYNLSINQYEFLIGHNNSVIYIFIQDVPRIIQLIMTDKSCPSQIIESFDMSHVMSYYDGKQVFSTPLTISQFDTNTTELYHKSKHRMIKYFERNLDIYSDVFTQGKYILNSFESDKIISYDKQKYLYSSTNNLSDCIKLKEQIKDIFSCTTINIKSFEFITDEINMFGNFQNYLQHQDNSFESEIVTMLKKPNNNFFDKFDSKNYEIETIDIKVDKYNNWHKSHNFIIKNYNSFYIPCEFVEIIDNTKDFLGQGPNNYDYNDINPKIQIIFKVNLIQPIKYLLEILKLRNNIFEKYIKEQKNFLFTDNNRIWRNFKLQYEITDSIYNSLPLNEDESGITLCSNIYSADVDKFKKMPFWSKLFKISKGTKMYCMFELLFYIRYKFENNKLSAEYFNINLKLNHINL